MNPSREACEKCLVEHPIEVMATLASGYLRPTEAYSYLGALQGVDGSLPTNYSS